MMKPLAMITALVICVLGATAQTPNASPSSEVLQSCLLVTGPTEWARLKLSTDQLERVRRIQEACKEECDVKGVKKVDNPISNADGKTVMAELVNILTKDQYRAWVAYCTGTTAGGKPTN